MKKVNQKTVGIILEIAEVVIKVIKKYIDDNPQQ